MSEKPLFAFTKWRQVTKTSNVLVFAARHFEVSDSVPFVFIPPFD